MVYAQTRILENETHEILWDFEIQTDHLTLTRRPDLEFILRKDENVLSCGFCRSGRRQSGNKRKRKDWKILGSCQRTKKALEHESIGDTNCN